MGTAVEIGLLGPVEIRRDGTVVGLPGAPQRVLLARLALSPGAAVPVAELVDVLWGEDPPTGAVANLQSYVSRLRRVLGADQVTHGPGGYRLHVKHADVDIGRAQQFAADARPLAKPDPARAAGLLSDALQLWRGEPLAGLPDRPAFAAERVRLTEWRLQLIEERLGLLLDAGRAAEALPDLERVAAAHPLHEGVHTQLMRGLHQTGRTAEALQVAEAYRHRLAEDTGLDPGAGLAAMIRRVLADDPALQPQRPQTGPRRHAPRDRFVGRQAELARLCDELPRRRLISVVGPGGVGKTRLILELLDRGAPEETAFLVELAATTSAADVPSAVAAALGLQTAPEGAVTAIADRLGAEAVLLVLDNCEHLADPARQLVDEMLARCPGLRVLATSRQRLGVPGELVVRLDPLPVPDQVELFCDRAALLRAGFDGSGPARELVAGICGLVDGLPLAVELAARRESVFGLAQLRERLAAGLDVLDPAGADDRFRAVRPAVEWSYRLLDPAAAALFDRLAVCRGGFTLDAVGHLRPPDVGSPPVLLAELVEASMVLPDLAADPPRYRVLETMRQVGIGHLTGEQHTDASAAHARWMHEHVGAVHRLQCERSPRAAALLRQELTNLRAALGWLIDTGRWDDAARLAIPAAVALSDYPSLDMLGQLGRLETVPAEAQSALCRIGAGAARWLQGESAPAEQLLTTALQRGDEHPLRWVGRYFRLLSRMGLGDAAGVADDTGALVADTAAPAWAQATGVCCAALIHLFQGDRPLAQAWLTSHEHLLSDVAEVDGLIAYTWGELAADDDPAAALIWFDLAHRRCEAAGLSYNREVAAIGRTAVLIRLGRHAEAVPACRDLVIALCSSGMWPQLWTVLRLVAELLIALGDHEPAAVLLDAADRDPYAPAVLGPDRARQAALREQVAARWAAAQRVEGRAGAVTVALAALATHQRH